MFRVAIRGEAGFSLIELLLAMTLFSFGLLVIALGFLGLFSIYQSGVSSRHTQSNIRLAMDRLVQTGRQAQSFNIASGGASVSAPDVLCMAGPSKKYYVSANKLWEADWDGSSPCAAGGGTAAITSTDAFVASFKAERFDYTTPGCNTNPADPAQCQLSTVRIDLTLSSVDPSNLIANPTYQNSLNCPPRLNVCAVSQLDTTVTAVRTTP